MRCFASCSIHIGTFNENRAGLSSQLYFFVLRLENMIGKYHGYDTKEIELLSPKPQTITMSEDHVALLSNSIDEMPAPKADRSQRESFQPLTSKSIGELLSPIPGVMEESPAGNKVLNNSSIDELLNPKTATPTGGRLQPLNSKFISLAKLLKEICVRT